MERTSIIPEKSGNYILIKGADDNNWIGADEFFRFMDPKFDEDTPQEFNEFLTNTYGMNES